MDQITRNNLDHLVMKVTTHLTKMIEKALEEVDGIGLVSESDLASICERALRETAVSMRVKLHAEAWADDSVARAIELAKTSVLGKVQRAARGSSRRGTPPF